VLFALFFWVLWCLTFIVLCCVIDLFVWVWLCLTFITQDIKRQTPPHPNKQINNTTQDNKRQTPPHPNKQVNNTTQDNKRQTPPHPNCLFGCGDV
jgi:cytoskeletal protein RodZ